MVYNWGGKKKNPFISVAAYYPIGRSCMNDDFDCLNCDFCDFYDYFDCES